MVLVEAESYLNAEDIETEIVTDLKVIQIADGTFDCCEKKVMAGDGTERFVLYTEDGNITLNVTNIKNLEKGFKTKESKHWIGHKVKIVNEETEYKNKPVRCLRVYPIVQEKIKEEKK